MREELEKIKKEAEEKIDEIYDKYVVNLKDEEYDWKYDKEVQKVLKWASNEYKKIKEKYKNKS